MKDLAAKYIKSYTAPDGRQFRHTTTVRHNGTVIAVAMDDGQNIYYSVLNMDRQGVDSPLDINYWDAEPQELPFPAELDQVGYRAAGVLKIPEVLKDGQKDIFMSTTARLTADAPLQALSDGKLVYLFRQAIAADATERNVFVKDRLDNDIALVNNTLLLDRFVYVDGVLKPKLEVRYQRSRKKDVPASRKDTLGYEDLEKNAFYEPTHELEFVRNLTDGRFSALLIPTSIPNVDRWQIFAANAATGRIDAFNIERDDDGLFNTKGTRYYTCPDHPEVFEREPGKCPVDEAQALVPIISTEGFAESALQFDGKTSVVKIFQASQLDLTDGTVEIWLKPTWAAGSNGYDPTVVARGSAAHGYSIRVADDFSGIIFHRGNTDLLFKTALAANIWHHLAVVSEQGQIRAFVDGKPVDTAKTGDFGEVTPAEMFLGAEADLGNGLSGVIDEMRLWNRSRAVDELNDDKNHRLVGNEPGLVGYWRLDEDGGDLAYDQTDSANHGRVYAAGWVVSDAPVGDHPGVRRSSFLIADRMVVSGLATMQYYQQEDTESGYDAEKKPMKRNARVMLAMATALRLDGLVFDGKKSYLAVPALDAIDGDLTVEAWVNLRRVTGWSPIWNANGWNSVGFLHLQFIDDRLRFSVFGNSPTDATFDSRFQADVWYHVAIAYSPTEKTVTLFVNGELKQKIELVTAVTPQLAAGRVGAWNQEKRFFAGTIDELRVWRVVRTAKDILADMGRRLEGNEPGLLAYWPFAEGIDDIAHEAVAGKDGRLNAAFWGKYTAVSFGRNYVAALDFAVSRAGKLAQAPDEIVLKTVDNSTGNKDTINTSLDEITALEDRVFALRNLLPQQVLIKSIETHAFDIGEYGPESFRYFRTSSFSITVPAALTVVLNYSWEVPDLGGGTVEVTLTDTSQSIFGRINRLVVTRTPGFGDIRKQLDTAENLLAEKKADLARLNGEVGLPMPVVFADPDGLIVSGAVLGFAWTIDTPLLFESVNGRLSLYFRGQKDEFFATYYDVRTGRPSFELPADQGSVQLIGRAAGRAMDGTVIGIEDAASSPNLCKVTFSSPATGIEEIWDEVPRNAQDFATTLNGTAKPIFIGTLAKMLSGEIGSLEVRGRLQRELAAGRRLAIGENRVVVKSTTPVFQGTVIDFATASDNNNAYMEMSEGIAADAGTIELWLKFANIAEDQTIFDASTPGELLVGKYFFIDIQGKKLRFHIEDLDDADFDVADVDIDPATSGVDDNWHHVAAVWHYQSDPASPQPAAQLYLDGELVAADTRLAGQRPQLRNAFVGKSRSGYMTKGRFKGQIGEILQWNIARTQPQIREDMNRLLKGSEPELLGLWRFESGQNGTVVRDYSIRKMDATAHGNLPLVVVGENASLVNTLIRIDPKIVLAQSIGENAPIYLLPYDYAANAHTNKETYQLKNGSLLFLVDSSAGTGNVHNRPASAEGGSTLPSQWFADSQGTALALDGRADYAATDGEAAAFDVDDDVSLEAWVNPTSIPDGIARVVHHNTPNSHYSLGLQAAESQSAIEFDGKDDVVRLGNPDHLNFTGQITIEAWIRPKATDGLRNIVAHGHSSNTEIFLRVNSGKYEIGSWNGSNHLTAFAIPDDDLNKWVHLAGVYDGITWRLYRNGFEVSTSADATGALQVAENWAIGARGTATERFFKGMIDEVRIWQVARTAEQIRDNYNRRLAGNAPGLVGYWYFEDGVATDYSASNSPGVLAGGPRLAASPIPHYTVFTAVGDATRKTKDLVLPCGLWNHLAVAYNQSHALQFSSENAVVNCGNEPTLNVDGDLTIEAIVKLQTTAIQDKAILSKGTVSSGEQDQQVPYALYVHYVNDNPFDPRIVFAFEDTDARIHTFVANTSISFNQVHRISVTREKRTEKDPNDENKVNQKLLVKIYSDGVAIGGNDNYEAVTPGTNDAPLELGRAYGRLVDASTAGTLETILGKTPRQFFGVMSEVRLWNRALPANEIAQNRTIIGREKGLVSWWRFEENDGKIANDSKSNNHGVITGAKWVKNPDPEASTLKVFANGSSYATRTWGSGDGSTPTRGDTQTATGTKIQKGALTEKFHGHLDEIRIWKAARSEEQIQDNLFGRLMSDREQLIAYYDCDATNTALLKDQSGLGNDLRMGSQALQIASPAQNVVVSPMAGFPATELTFECWIQVDAPAKTGAIVSYYLPTDNPPAPKFQVANPKNLTVTIDGASSGGTGVALDDGAWHHLAVTWRNGDGQLKIVVDGEKQYPKEQVVKDLAEGEKLPDGGNLVFGFVPALASTGQNKEQAFAGKLAEIRLWQIARAVENLADGMNKRLRTVEPGLVAHWPANEIVAGTQLEDLVGKNHGTVTGVIAVASFIPIFQENVLSTAPISREAAIVRSALAGVRTNFHDRIQSRPGVQEYGDIQTDADGNLISVMKRCYAYIQNGVWQLLTGYKVGDLELEWIGQAQYDPQLIGFIEGAPLVPSENLTIRIPDLGQNYEQVSAVNLSEAENVIFSYSTNRDSGVDTSLSLKAGFGFKSKTLGGIGVATTLEEADTFIGLKGNMETSNSWLDERQVGFGKTTTRFSRMFLQGAWENPDQTKYPEMGRRYIPKNVGFALVQSETADVFVLRLKHRDPEKRVVVALRMQPNQDIPKDWNIIIFPMNPKYVKQGTLDGKIGLRPDIDDYPNAIDYSSNRSYFKPIEAYALKNRIEKEQEQLRLQYQEYSSEPAGAKGLAIGAGAGGVLGGIAGGLIGASVGSAIGGATTTYDLPDPAKVNMYNTYVWTADGGLFSETQHRMDAQHEVMAGAFTLKGLAGLYADIKVAISKVAFAVELEALVGGHLNLMTQKRVDSENDFGVEIELDVERDIHIQSLEQARLAGSTRGKFDAHGNPIKCPGKVDGYRFMTFYLQADKENFRDFKNKIIDREWLEQSSDPNAAALRQAAETESGPWRVLHRVTYVSRVLPEVGTAGVSSADDTLRAANIESNWELIKRLEPYVRTKTGDYAELSEAVRVAIDSYLPELTPAKDDIVRYMSLYYQLFP